MPEKTTKIEGFADRDNERLSCIIWPTEHGWAWVIFSGDGSIPGSAKSASSALTMAEAAEAVSEYLKTHKT